MPYSFPKGRTFKIFDYQPRYARLNCLSTRSCSSETKSNGDYDGGESFHTDSIGRNARGLVEGGDERFHTQAWPCMGESATMRVQVKATRKPYTTAYKWSCSAGQPKRPFRPLNHLSGDDPIPLELIRNPPDLGVDELDP
jgi:hypothetical protein